MTHLAVFLAVVAAAVVSMAVFAVVGRRDADADRRGSQFLMGAGNFLVHWFMWVLSPADRLFLAIGATPDFFNFAGLAFGALAGVLIASRRLELGGWAIILGGVCDIFDGRMARARNLSSPYGAFMDSTLDRFVEVFAFLGFVFALRFYNYGALVAAAAISGSLLVSYTRARGESVGVLCKEGLMQRAERLVLTALACLTDGAITAHFGWRPGLVLLAALLLITAGTFLTAAQRTVLIARELRRRA